MTTKRTTANTATDTDGLVIRLLKTRLTADNGRNSLLYTDLRQAFAEKSEDVITLYKDTTMTKPIPVRRTIGVYLGYRTGSNKELFFNIGCHIFTLKMFNRILRAAGIRTTKPQTLKRFAAAA